MNESNEMDRTTLRRRAVLNQFQCDPPASMDGTGRATRWFIQNIQIETFEAVIALIGIRNIGVVYY